MDKDTTRETDSTRPTAPLFTDIRRKRMRYRAWRRGFKEMDLVLGHFADDHLADLSPAELDAFEVLLAESDADLYQWICGTTIPEGVDNIVLKLIIDVQNSSVKT